MTENKPFWDQVAKEEAELDIFRERNAKRRYKADPIRCSNCGTGVKIGESCSSCGLLND